MAAMATNSADSVASTVSKAAVSEPQTEEQKAEAIENRLKGSGTSRTLLGFAIAIGLGIAAAGGALGQGRCAAAALDGIARNPGAAGKIFTPMILGLALIESLVLYSLVMGFVLLGKI
jgi:F-type H+-transporting ATPase subunit c